MNQNTKNNIININVYPEYQHEKPNEKGKLFQTIESRSELSTRNKPVLREDYNQHQCKQNNFKLMIKKN